MRNASYHWANRPRNTGAIATKPGISFDASQSIAAAFPFNGSIYITGAFARVLLSHTIQML